MISAPLLTRTIYQDETHILGLIAISGKDTRGSVPMSEGPGTRIAVDELTQAAFSGVLAALKANDLAPRSFPGPILVGIIAWPELSQFREQFQRAAADATESE